ncbi:MAG: GNAT family N-acetyltransferase [Fimbriimonadaceae bacterium]
MISISEATASDVELLLQFITELAEYEKLSEAVVGTAVDLRRTLFGHHRFAAAAVARVGVEPVGFALYFFNYSTFLARPGIYLEDLFVRPAHRGHGVGKALLRHVAREAVRVGAGRLEWSVLDWNDPAIGFYKRLGATPLDDWTVFRLTGSALKEFGASPKAESPIPVLRTPRLVLRAGVLADAPRITELLQDPAIEANLGGLPTPYALADAEAYLAGIGMKADELDWLLEHPDAGVIGSIHMSLANRHRRGYLGFWLGSSFWGQGYMPEALRRVIAYGFGELELERVEGEHFTGNLASGRAMGKAGMRCEGVRVAAFRKRGEQLDLAVYGLARRDSPEYGGEGS